MNALFFLLTAIVVVMLILLGWSIIIGWVLTQIFAFTLFEGSLLALGATCMAAYLILSTLIDRLSLPDDVFAEDDLFEDENDDLISPERFFPTPAERTWEAWFRFQVANTIYANLRKNPGSLDKPQKQELSVRLSEICIAAIKHKSPKSRSFHLTIDDVRRQMDSMELKPYDDDILEIGVDATNLSMVLPPAETVIREKLWNQIMPSPDLF